MIQKDLSSSLSKFALHFGLDIETEQGARTCIYMLLEYYIFCRKLEICQMSLTIQKL